MYQHNVGMHPADHRNREFLDYRERTHPHSEICLKEN